MTTTAASACAGDHAAHRGARACRLRRRTSLDPGFLNDVLSEAPVAANPPRNKGVQRPQCLGVDLDQDLFGQHAVHTSID